MPALSAVLLDVGGTLWPDQWPGQGRATVSLQRLRSVLPAATDEQRHQLLDRLTDAAAGLAGQSVQDTDELVWQALHDVHLPPTPDQVAAVRAAMCLPAVEHVRLFDGAVGLLRTLKRLELRTVVVSNVAWRDANAYRRDFQDFGCGSDIDEVITSADLGVRKPHPGMLVAALRMADCPPERCVMVGNSEVNDIRPAVQQGMGAVLVQIEDEPRATTRAHATARSLPEVAAIVAAWHRTGW
jgi:FMN phosphatase YigB (HAD superfamily)